MKIPILKTGIYKFPHSTIEITVKDLERVVHETKDAVPVFEGFAAERGSLGIVDNLTVIADAKGGELFGEMTLNAYGLAFLLKASGQTPVPGWVVDDQGPRNLSSIGFTLTPLLPEEE